MIFKNGVLNSVGEGRQLRHRAWSKELGYMAIGILALPGIFQSISEDGYCFNSAFFRWISPGWRAVW
jgi:hypothetical protein